MGLRHKNRLPVFDSVMDRPRVVIHAFDEDEMGIPLVELTIDGEVINLTRDQAERIGKGLIDASQRAATKV